MENIINLELIQISTKKGKLIGLLSFQDTTKINGDTNGFDTIEIPINIRPIQFSSRGNFLVDQSVKEPVNESK